MRRNGFGGRSSTTAQPQQQQAAPSQNGNGGDRKPPVYEARAGLLKATCWENAGDKGPWVSVTLSRSYRTGGENGEWKSAQSFSKDDLLALAELLRHVWNELNFGESQEGGDQPF